MKRLSLKKRLLYLLLTLALLYVAAEAVVSVGGYYWWWDTWFVLYEDVGEDGQCPFDPVRGYSLSPKPARQCLIANGGVEYLTTARGNAQGFPDRSDFTPGRQPPFARRLAVFGDSFTAGQYLEHNWPDRVEDLTRAAGRPVELLNFALDGGGLANWWSVLTRFVAARDYEIDGVVFAVYEDDLWRPFFFAEQRGHPQFMLAYSASWDPRAFPQTAAEARPLLGPSAGYLVSSEEFDGALRGRWPPSVPRRFRLILLSKAQGAWRQLWAVAGRKLSPPGGARSSDPPPAEAQPDYRQQLIADIRHYLQRRGLPALVVFLPSRSRLLYPSLTAKPYREDAQAFAEALGATFVDGSQAFAGMSGREIRAHYFRNDSHWNQAGSDRFADFLVGQLAVWEAAKEGAGPRPDAGSRKGD